MGYNKSLFEGVPKKDVNKSRFNLSFEWKAQILPGYLTPCLLLETLPQDEWRIETEFMFRFAPLYFPIMHKMTMRCDYFFIPNRILWQRDGASNVGWTEWINNSQEAVFPFVDAEMKFSNEQFHNKVLAFMGIPLLSEGELWTTEIGGLNAMPLSAYLKIWDEYYRVPQLEDEIWFNLEAGNNTTNFNTAFNTLTEPKEYLCLSSKWEKDYFTSALPTPQIGDAIQIPLIENSLLTAGSLSGPRTVREVGSGNVPTGPSGIDQDGSGGLELSGTGDDVFLDIQETAATIKQLRIAEVLQSYYERIMKVGNRYRDFIKGLWGVDPEPHVVDVPIHLGARFGRVQIADVMTQAYTTVGDHNVRTGDYTGQANLYENGGDVINYFCREHGFIMAILQVNPNTSYGQGIARLWRRQVPTDFPLDMFANIGDQEILKEEVLYNPTTLLLDKNQETFGYIPRFSEMRYQNNIHVGNLGLNFTTGGSNLGVSQHLGRIFDTDTWNELDYTNFVISEDFINTSNDQVHGNVTYGNIRISDVFRTLPAPSIAQSAYEGIIFTHLFHSVHVERALPYYSTPRL